MLSISRKYHFNDQEKLYFVSFATVYWLDVFTRNEYRTILLDSLRHCQAEKGLELYAWCLMPSHVHLIMGTVGEPMQGILRDMKRHTSKKITAAITDNPQESRREWLLWMLERAGKKNSNNERYQFWQQHNKPIELNTIEKLRQRLNYLHENPVVAGFVEKPEDWLYSSAVDYYTNRKGLIDNLIFVRV